MPARANWISCTELPSGDMLLTRLSEDSTPSHLAFLIPAEERENVALNLFEGKVTVHDEDCDCLTCDPTVWGIDNA